MPQSGEWTVLEGGLIVLGLDEDFATTKRKHLVPETILRVDRCHGKFLYLDAAKTLDFIRRGGGEDVDYDFPAVSGLRREKTAGSGSWFSRFLGRG